MLRIRAGSVHPVTAPPIEDGAVLVDDRGTIAAVGPNRCVPEPPAPGAHVLEFPDAVLVPGLVNTHTHLELTHLAGRNSEPEFARWIRTIRALKDATPPDEFTRSAERGVRLLGRGGDVRGGYGEHGRSDARASRAGRSGDLLSGGVRSRSRAGAHEPRRAGTGAHPARLAGGVPAPVGRFAAPPLHRGPAPDSRRGRLCSEPRAPGGGAPRRVSGGDAARARGERLVRRRAPRPGHRGAGAALLAGAESLATWCLVAVNGGAVHPLRPGGRAGHRDSPGRRGGGGALPALDPR